MIIRITNNDDFRILFEINDTADLEKAIRHAWQKIATVRPQHFFHCKEIQQEILASTNVDDLFSPETNYLRQILTSRAIEERKIIPTSFVVHAFNRHAYGMTLEAAAVVQEGEAGRPPSAWIVSGGYSGGEDTGAANPEQELTVTRNENTISRMLSQLKQADEHAAFLVKVNNLRKQALAIDHPNKSSPLT